MIKRFKFFSPDPGDMVGSGINHATDNVAEHIEQGTESIHKGTEHLEEAIKTLIETQQKTLEHVSALAEHITHLHPVEAAQEIPAAAVTEVEGAGEAGGETL